MQNNNTMLPDKLDRDFFNRSSTTGEQVQEAIKRLNNYNGLVEALQAFVRYDKEKGLQGWIKDLDSEEAAEFSPIINKAKQLLNELKP